MIRTAAGCIAAAVLFCLPVFARPSTSANCAVLMDAATGRVLYEQNASQRSLIASTTKIMTALLAIEECDLRWEVRVPKEAVGVEGSSLYLKENEILTVEELLYGLMLHSGNDAAVTLAMHCSGSVEAFAEKMNRKAEALGLANTHFVNPHGLDGEEHFSTAYDLARLTAYAMEDPVFRKIVSTKTITFGHRTFTNHNKLLWQYEHAVGVKTGYTNAAGRILVSAAEKNGRRLICVTIHDRNDWQDHIGLYDYGFSTFARKELVAAGQCVAEVPVICGSEASVHAVTDAAFSYPLAAQERVELRAQLPAFVYAPVMAGEKAGNLIVLVDGIEVKSLPLYWRYSVWEEAS